MPTGRRKRNKSGRSLDKRRARLHRTTGGGKSGQRAIWQKPKIKSERKSQKTTPGKAITGWRLWLFRIACLTLIPALFFSVLELSLRAAGYGYPPSATIKCKVNGMDAFGDNVKFGWRFFPRNIAQEFDPFIFPADKPADTYRIFVLGGSAAQGTPDPAYSFGRILRAMLQQSYPTINFEVVVAAMPAINSHVVLELGKDLAKHELDLFVVYLGHNEVVGPYGAGTVFAPLSSSLSLIRTGMTLKTTRLGQLLADLSVFVGAERNVPRFWRGLEMFLEQQVRADDPRLETVYQHFQKNLEDICRVLTDSEAKTILCTVGSNLKDCPPFASLHRPGLSETDEKKWQDTYEQGIAHETADDYTEAIEHYLAAIEIDQTYADLHFRLGHCYWATDQYEKARGRYIRARELDTLRFRADSRINDIIRAVAADSAKQGVYLVDVVKTFEEHSHHEIAGKELFYEHVHLNFNGNYLLAKTIFEQVAKIFPQRLKRRKVNEHSLLTQAECAERLAHNAWAHYNDVYKVLNYYVKKPPFTNQLYHDEQVRELEGELKALEARLTPEVLKTIVAQYKRLLQQEPSDVWLRWRYAELLSVRLQNEQTAAEQCRLTQMVLPHSHKPHLLLALSLGRLNRLDEAIRHLAKVTKLKPTSGNAYHCLGLAYQAQAQTDKAVKSYSAAIRLQPNNTEACKNLAELLSQQGKLVEAVQTCRKGLHFVPDSPILHCSLGILLTQQGKKRAGIEEIQTALQIDPNSTKIRRVLKAILDKDN